MSKLVLKSPGKGYPSLQNENLHFMCLELFSHHSILIYCSERYFLMKFHNYFSKIFCNSLKFIINFLELDLENSFGCNSAETCSECIQKHPACGWCSEKDFDEDGISRCDSIDVIRNRTKKCAAEFLTYPQEIISKKKDERLTKSSSRKLDDRIVQLRPQEVSLRLRPKSPQMFKFKFRQVKDYPVDLYYLMDLSRSMHDDKNKLAELGSLLAADMNKITSNFRLGFGSFVDKVVMPFTSTVPEKLIKPCDTCVAPYGFKNHMALNLNTSQFSDEVQAASISANLDQPEGGFDAIMQAMVCQSKIGWRSQSRKLMLFSTDSSFHSAGDGRIGGIIVPNDGNDYPSISQISHKAKEKKVNIIFAVTADQIPIYERVSDKVEGSSFGTLSNDSSNIVELVKKQYNKITSSVQIKDNAPSMIKITYYSKCTGDTRYKTNHCKGLKVGTTVQFEAEIELLYCPTDQNLWKQNFTIYPVGLESLLVRLEMICGCDCEKKQEEFESQICFGNGTYSCGTCKCNADRYGRFCECEKNNIKDMNSTRCYKPGDVRMCSGRGHCECGVCKCNRLDKQDRKIYGKFCECDNFSCDRHEGLVCSGLSNGRCDCGSCACFNGRTGNACECESNDQCFDPETNKICSGNGHCECGKCICNKNSDDRSFSGEYCQIKPLLKPKCEDILPCVQCVIFNSGPLAEQEFCGNCTSRTEILRNASVEVTSDDEELCIRKGENGCKIKFIYSVTNESSIKVYAQETQVCPQAVNTLFIVFGVIGGIVVIGLALLFIWKILTTLHDRREFAKFLEETKAAKWDTTVNPIFKGATSTFKNPTFIKAQNDPVKSY
ncbi:Integrin beta-PS [Nymphon striatum]|nr:Integrin beta-PS [Nymphon striatum]